MLPPALVLFDIDGTLVRRAGPHHRQALVDAVRDVAGLESTTEGIPVQGMLDPDILTVMLLNAGVDPPEIRRAMPALIISARTISPHRIAPRISLRIEGLNWRCFANARSE